MKYNTPKELWNLYKELVAFKKQKQDMEALKGAEFKFPEPQWRGGPGGPGGGRGNRRPGGDGN